MNSPRIYHDSGQSLLFGRRICQRFSGDLPGRPGTLYAVLPLSKEFLLPGFFAFAFTRDGERVVVQRDLDLFLLETRELYDYLGFGHQSRTSRKWGYRVRDLSGSRWFGARNEPTLGRPEIIACSEDPAAICQSESLSTTPARDQPIR
jgi:hypothetical protein